MWKCRSQVTDRYDKEGSDAAVGLNMGLYWGWLWDWGVSQ